jgi:hypothetical protein
MIYIKLFPDFSHLFGAGGINSDTATETARFF